MTSAPATPVKQIAAGVLDVGYADVGPADGPAVVLLHGWPYDIHTFSDVSPRLAAEGYRLRSRQGHLHMRDARHLLDHRPALIVTERLFMLVADLALESTRAAQLLAGLRALALAGSAPVRKAEV